MRGTVRGLLIGVTVGLLATTSPAAGAPGTYAVGVAQVDITPNYPVRLSGFGNRRTELEGVAQKIWAKALAIDDGEPAVLITVDNCGVPADLVREVAARLGKKAGVRPERLAVTATHTHCAPMLTGVLPTLFGQPIPADQQDRIDRYTRELADHLERAALAALADRKPARLAWGIGKVGFARNRRTPGGPVDHDLPVLTVRDVQGQLRAVYVSYACHCVTLSFNLVSGDWAGHAQEAIQAAYPGAVALVSVGCGADSNPTSGVTGDRVDVAAQQGAAVAAEVRRVLQGFLTPVTGPLTARLSRFELPLAELPTPAEWEERARRTDAVGYHARVQLARLDRGTPLRTRIDYSVQTWAFGTSLGMVFLPGEVVVDYALRLKRELDGLRLWTNAYANDAPCYIPSERVLKEGRYEGATAMTYYDVPAPFRPGLEDRIVAAVREQLGGAFPAAYDPARTGGSRALSPQQSLATLRTKPDLRVELMAAEPLIVDPVALAWGPDGKLWVAEMHDYPSGTGGDYQPGGRVRVLEDRDGDGRYDTATVFLAGIPFPTGVTVWRKGVLVCAAPDILYAEDTDGDGKADVVKKLFSGFGTHNYQARVNSLEYGLDGWAYGSCGLFGGTIRSFAGGEPVALGDRDFRIRPDRGVLEPATGRTQQGRVRDDWGNWFGCTNSSLCRHYPLADHSLRRNPHLVAPSSTVSVGAEPDHGRVYPVRGELQLFKLSGPPGRATAACGIVVYRDDLLGPQYTGDTFTGESVNLLVHRLHLTPRGSTFAGQRAPDERESEFLAAADNWFRPVQVRTGPDGCLWVVDMYRFLIEHPRWVPPEDLARLDVRAGSTLGRIYRISPRGRDPRPIPRLDRLDAAGLVAALDSPNGWQRDLAGQMLLWQPRAEAVAPLMRLAETCPRAEARLHALCVLDGLGRLPPGLILRALGDAHPGVRRHAVRLAEKFVAAAPELGAALTKLVTDEDAQVRLQLACSLGEWDDARAAEALARLALDHADDPYLLAAVLSSVRSANLGEFATRLLAGSAGQPPPAPLAQRLLAVATALGDRKTLLPLLHEVLRPRDGQFLPWQLAALDGAFETLDRRRQSLEDVGDDAVRQALPRVLEQARTVARHEKAAPAERLVAVRVLGREAARREGDLTLLGKLLAPRHPPEVQAAAVATLGRLADPGIGRLLVAGWDSYTPALRAQALELLLSRRDWLGQLLDSLEKKEVAGVHLDATRRERLLRHRDEKIRAQAARLFGGAARPDRQKVLEEYQDVARLPGDAARGKAVFAKSCAACHRLDQVGHTVGPNLAALANKSPQFLLTEILDPSRNLDSRYTEYVALTRAGQTFTGLLASESAASVTLHGPEAKGQTFLRSDLEELRGTGRSLMPEGLEKDLSRQDLADLIAYLAVAEGPKGSPHGPGDKADPAALARQLLDDGQPREKRQAVIDEHPALAPELVTALTADLQPGTAEEYRRIPWIWRVAVAAGKRNDAAQLRRLLAVSLPKAGEPLHDWQAVVLGGGIVNGISLDGQWPRARLDEVLQGHLELGERWGQALPQAAKMADDEKVKPGTRYDALRMIALDTFQHRGPQLAKYLAKGANAELQMGAISGLSDIDMPQVAPLLLDGLEHFAPRNRALALDALLRTDTRTAALLDALEQGRVRPALLGETHRKALRGLKDEALRARAAKLLPGD